MPPSRINMCIKYMKTYALIKKFMGIWRIEKALLHWISAKWKPKAHFDIQLGLKGFFTIIFTLLEDRDRVLEGGPYFFNSARIFLRNWMEHFNLDMKKFA